MPQRHGEQLESLELPSPPSLEVSVGARALLGSNFHLDPATTAAVLEHFNSEAGSELKNTEIIALLSDEKGDTRQVDTKTFHMLPVLPCTNPDYVDWDKNFLRISTQALNYRAISLLFNIATYGSVHRPSASQLDYGNRRYADLPVWTWLNNPAAYILNRTLRHREVAAGNRRSMFEQREVANMAADRIVLTEKD